MTASLLMLLTPLSGVCFEKPGRSIDVHFSHRGVSLPSKEREKIIGALDLVRKYDWCAFESVFVTAFADESEGAEDEVGRLATVRAAYLEALLRRYGVSAKVIFSHGETARMAGQSVVPLSTGAKAELEFLGSAWPQPCPYPLNAGGFRVAPGK